MRKLLHTLFTLTLLFSFSQGYAQLTNVSVDPGPYTYGSSIAATVTIGSTCIPITNDFDLYLSDATGSFANEIPIGRYVGFYTTFVNGTIPNFTPPIAPGTGYRVRVKLTSDPTVISDPSNTFEIKAGSPVTAAVTASATISTLPQIAFGYCTNRTGTGARITFTNASTAGGITTATIKNEVNLAFDPPLAFTTSTSTTTFTPGAAHYTLTVRDLMPDGTVATRSYFVINNPANTAFATSGSGTVCLPGGALVYDVDTQNPAGIQKNFPGNTYRVSWGDDSESLYTLCQILQLGSQVSHTYLKSSCGSIFNGQYNVFGIEISVQSPFETCGRIGQPISTFARVVTVTENKFTGPLTACINTDVTFINTSLPGQVENGNSSDCTDNSVTYSWYVDGQLVLDNVPKATNFVYKFLSNKVYEVKLTSQGSGACQGAAFIQNICIQNPPQPSFTLPADPLVLCAPGVIKPTNTSIIDNNCNPTTNYLWTVTGGPVSYDTGSATDREPTFRFTTPGVYKIKLSVTTASCGAFITPEKTIIIDGPPTAVLSNDISLCNLSSYDFNNTTTGPTKTTFTGSFTTADATYLWEVTGGDFEFIEGTSANSQYPKIQFKEFKTYTIKVTHTNSCGTATDTQVITFSTAPTVSAGSDQTICFDGTATLAGSISAPVTSYSWVGGTGTFSDRNILNPTYTPSAAEKAAGLATLTLQAVTDLAPPCNVLNDEIKIIIQPEIIITSMATVSVCTGSVLNYQPTATPANTTFTWTATGTANAGGYANSPATPGTGPITDMLTNSDPLNNATVTYTIVPTNNGCTGVPFILTVTITPRPVITASGPMPSICTGSTSGITLSSNLAGTTYTWTNTVTNGITGASTITTPSSSPVINDHLMNPGTTQGSVTYVITPYSASGCAGAPVQVTVAVDPALTVPNAGPDESICNLTTYTLNGNPIAVGTGNWSLVSGQSGVSFDPANPVTPVSGLVGGQVYTFRWTVTSSGACPAIYDEVVVTVNIPTVGGTTSGTAVVCEAANSGTITLSGNTGAVLNWQSSVDGGATWTDIANTTTTLTYTNIIASTQYRAVIKNGQCNAEFSSVTLITVTPATTITNAGPDQVLCHEVTASLNADASLKAGESGIWTLTAGQPTITFTNASNPKTTVTGLVPGQNYTFTWTITGNSPCGPTRDDVVITDYLPLTNTISSTSTVVCYNQVVAITGSTPTGGDGTYSYLWEVSLDGNNWNTISGQTGKDLSYQLQATSYFRRTVTSNICPLVSNILQIVAQPPITNNTIAADQTICTGIAPAGLTGSNPQGSDGNFNYQWQLSIDNGASWTDIQGAVFPDFVPPVLTTTSVYRRIVSTITCNGNLRSTSNTVTITVKPNAKAEFTYNTDKACTPFVIDANNVKAVAYPDRNATYTWFADNVQIGTGITFPGYTITNSNQSVTIKLVASPSQGCQPDEFSHVFSTNQSVAASFTQSATSGCGPLVVNFVNTSTSLTDATFRWDFGNGTTSSQTLPSPVTYQPDPTGKDTTYTVTLTATTSCGTSSITSTVFVKAKPISVFSPNKTVGCSPMTVTFSNTSPGSTNTYYYDFGDGTLLTKTDKSNVQHTYITNVVRDFVVKMVAQNECGSDVSSYTIRVSPNTVTPELVVNANEKQGCAPFTVNFYNNSRGGNVFRYDFGDGATQLTRSAPEVVAHTFANPGTYTITLLASNGCSDTTTTETITVLPQPATSFSADVTLGCPGLVVQFSNTSTDGVSYVWDFGDGTTSNEFAPKHTFSGTQEFYTVTLTATNSLGCTGTSIMNQYIHVVQPPVAAFNVAPSTLISIPNYTFRFEDESTNSPSIWAWDFGDGKTSVLKSPSHTYLDTGKYVVTLRVTNQQGCFTTTFKTVTIVGVPGYLYVPNSFMPGSDTPELRIFSAKGSGIKTWRFSIFNKWGQQLWETTLLNEGRPVEGWDGTFNSVLQPQGVYFWKIDVEFVNGTAWKGVTYDSSAPKKTGVIHLLR